MTRTLLLLIALSGFQQGDVWLPQSAGNGSLGNASLPWGSYNCNAGTLNGTLAFTSGAASPQITCANAVSCGVATTANVPYTIAPNGATSPVSFAANGTVVDETVTGQYKSTNISTDTFLGPTGFVFALTAAVNQNLNLKTSGTGALQLNGSSFHGVIAGPFTTPATSIPAVLGCADTSEAVTGATVDKPCDVSPHSSPTSAGGAVWGCYASASGTIQLHLCCVTATCTANSITWTVVQ